MCGIVGYVGESQAAPILLEGLEKLEYRGYDSAGIAVYDGKKINMKKAMGRLKVLNELTHGGEPVSYTHLDVYKRQLLKKGDPMYNPNLTLTKWDYSLRNNQKE